MCFSEKLQVSTGYVLGEICQTAGPIIHRVTKLWFVSSTGNIFHPPPPPPLKLFIWGGVACNPKNGPERDLVPGRYSRLRSLPRGGGESLSLIQALPDRFLFPDLSLICRVGFSDVVKRMGAAS